MGKMKEKAIQQMENELARGARNLAEATLRLIAALNEAYSKRTLAANQGLLYAEDDAEGEAKNILAKTQGA